MTKQTSKKTNSNNSVTSKANKKKMVIKAKKDETKNAITKKQTKKKKGFTLVELIAVVGLLAILMTMTALSVSSINKSVKSRQKNTLLNSIQVAAEKYVNDTGIKKVYVDTLIKEGYVSADDYDSTMPVIVDPTDENQNLNCYLYDFTEAGKGKYVEPSDTSSTECDMKPLSDVMLTIQYKIGTGTFNDYDGSWIKEEDVTLGVRSNNTSVVSDSDISSNSTWTTPLAPDVYHSPSGTYRLSGDIEDGYLNATYQVTVAKDGATYTASKLIKIDSKVPKITNVRVDDLETWTKEKYIYADFEDTGSGLAEYLISTKSSISSLNSSDKWSPIRGKFFSLNQQDFAAGRPGNKLTANGTYYVFVKDVAGNITMWSSIEVKNIDNIPPTCTLTGTSTTWTNSSRTISWGCSDNESGCDSTRNAGQVGSKTYTTSTKTDTKSEFTIYDIAGNSKICGRDEVGKVNIFKNYNVYVDTDRPTVTAFSINSTKAYNSIDAKYTITGSDSTSYIAGYCITSIDDSAYCTWTSSASDAAIKLGTTEGAGTSYKRYAYVKDAAGNIAYYSKSTTYTLYTTCTDSISDPNSDWSTCSVKCGGGTQTHKMIDKYLGSTCTSDSRECNKQTCCSSTSVDWDSCGDDWYWTTCTALCGGGTKHQYRTCNKVSDYDGSWCDYYTDTQNNNTPCNTQSCCKNTLPAFDSCYDTGVAWYCHYDCAQGKNVCNQYTDYANCPASTLCDYSDCSNAGCNFGYAVMYCYNSCKNGYDYVNTDFMCTVDPGGGPTPSDDGPTMPTPGGGGPSQPICADNHVCPNEFNGETHNADAEKMKYTDSCTGETKYCPYGWRNYCSGDYHEEMYISLCYDIDWCVNAAGITVNRHLLQIDPC